MSGPTPQDEIRACVTAFAAGKIDGQQAIAALHSLIERAEQAAREEGMAAYAGPVLALAGEWERNYANMLAGGFSGCSVGADSAAKRLRAALPTDAAEALARVRAEAWDRGYTSGHSNAMRRMSDEPNAPTTPNPHRATAHEAGTEGDR